MSAAAVDKKELQQPITPVNVSDIFLIMDAAKKTPLLNLQFVHNEHIF